MKDDLLFASVTDHTYLLLLSIPIYPNAFIQPLLNFIERGERRASAEGRATVTSCLRHHALLVTSLTTDTESVPLLARSRHKITYQYHYVLLLLLR
jgi:hypothetical protein